MHSGGHTLETTSTTRTLDSKLSTKTLHSAAYIPGQTMPCLAVLYKSQDRSRLHEHLAITYCHYRDQVSVTMLILHIATQAEYTDLQAVSK